MACRICNLKTKKKVPKKAESKISGEVILAPEVQLFLCRSCPLVVLVLSNERMNRRSAYFRCPNNKGRVYCVDKPMDKQMPRAKLNIRFIEKYQQWISFLRIGMMFHCG